MKNLSHTTRIDSFSPKTLLPFVSCQIQQMPTSHIPIACSETPPASQTPKIHPPCPVELEHQCGDDFSSPLDLKSPENLRRSHPWKTFPSSKRIPSKPKSSWKDQRFFQARLSLFQCGSLISPFNTHAVNAVMHSQDLQEISPT